jgi:CheY-like chemotaxis protein
LIDTKRSLELLGEYAVTIATDVHTGLEHLQDEPYHLVILDTQNLPMPVLETIESIRAVQADIAFVLAPDTPTVHAIARHVEVQGVINIPMSSRQLIPVIEHAIRDVLDNLPDTAKAPPVDAPQETVYIETLVDQLLHDDPSNPAQIQVESLDVMESGTHTLEMRIQVHDDGDTVHYVVSEQDERSLRLFEKLASEEPPIPSVHENGTVSDLARLATRSHWMRVLQVDDAGADEVDDVEDDASQSYSARIVLETVLNETTPIHAISIDTLVQNIQTRLPQDKQSIRPLPSWLKESKKFVREPIFLKDDVLFLDSDSQTSQGYTPTESDASDRVTVARPADDAGQAEPSATLDVVSDDPYVTQLAVTLTQMTTELAADATVLTRDNHIVAYSGDMSLEDIEGIRGEIREDWRTTNDEARIRFITLPSSGQDYMLYSKATVGGFTLSMLFAGTKQLRVIRQQGAHLVEALNAVADDDVMLDEGVRQPDDTLSLIPIAQANQTDNTDEAPADVGPKAAYTFIWMLADTRLRFSEHIAKQLAFWLDVQLNSLHWTVHKLQVYANFVYLYADIPTGDAVPSDWIRSLMERSDKIVKSEDDSLPDNLWADAYLVLTPGRDMDKQEIQGFLDFAQGEL